MWFTPFGAIIKLWYTLRRVHIKDENDRQRMIWMAFDRSSTRRRKIPAKQRGFGRKLSLLAASLHYLQFARVRLVRRLEVGLAEQELVEVRVERRLAYSVRGQSHEEILLDLTDCRLVRSF